MGIPSFFSHIIKNHNIIIKKPDNNTFIDNLYLDSNSIIYDIVHKYGSSGISNNEIFLEVCKKIDTYISQLKAKMAFIALDGVAPIAKLSQQRNRRIKNTILKNITNTFKEVETSWDTTQITPGTEFMKKLNDYIKSYYKSNPHIKLSLSDEPGEGEHKLFQYIRDNDHTNKTTVIYGLDADLIMLSLLHVNKSKNMYLYRETPVFIKQLDATLDESELYLLSMNQLSERLVDTIGTNVKTTSEGIIKDYVFLCFMLGNDFIPHTPVLNIRTNGIDILIELYQKFSREHGHIIDENGSISWKQFKQFCSLISEEERNYFIYENKLRDKFDKRRLPATTNEEKEFKLNLLPSLNREREIFINPSKDGWQARYYTTLFDVEYSDIRRKQISTNYIEALEWTWKYYSNCCHDWRWKYKYDYAPLFEDIVKYIPYYNHDFISFTQASPIKSISQLIYVLPKESHYLLSPKIQSILSVKYEHWYDKENVDFKWDYCKYLWEAHLTLPDINIDHVEEQFGKYEV